MYTIQAIPVKVWFERNRLFQKKYIKQPFFIVKISREFEGLLTKYICSFATKKYCQLGVVNC